MSCSFQDKIVEEFFMHKVAKQEIDLSLTIKDTKQNIAHLMLNYAPFVPAKFLLKRKDITMDLLNAKDSNGNTPLLHAASRNNGHTVRQILYCQNIKTNKLLDLSVRNRTGKTVLHYLVENRDEENFRVLLDYDALTQEVANIQDGEGITPMIACLTNGSPYMARDILIHPTGMILCEITFIECKANN